MSVVIFDLESAWPLGTVDTYEEYVKLLEKENLTPNDLYTNHETEFAWAKRWHEQYGKTEEKRI